MMTDSFHLQRFVDAQASVIADVRAELAAERKTSHWMWFVFPQSKHLGRSATARHFGLASLAEAQAFWLHPVLGARLKACTELVLAARPASAHQIFGSPDDLKFRSSMTLFTHAAPDEPAFVQALEGFFDATPDPLTLEWLALPHP